MEPNKEQYYLDLIVETDFINKIRKMLDESEVFAYPKHNNSIVYVHKQTFKVWLAVNRMNRVIEIMIDEEIVNMIEHPNQTQKICTNALIWFFGKDIAVGSYEPLCKNLHEQIMNPIDTYILGQTLIFAC